MKKWLIYITFVCLPMLLTGQVISDRLQLNDKDINLNPDTLKTQITTASRSKKYLEDLPVTVFIISRKEILEGGFTTLTDVLKSAPGNKVSQPGSALDGESFLMNGLYGNYYAKILIDGIPIQPSVVSGMPIAEQIPIRQAERIEIIYGPAAALYGGDALAGVINIIMNSNDRPVWAQSDISLGSNGYYNMNVMIGGKVGKNKNVVSYDFFGSYGKRSDMNVKYDVTGNYNPALYDSSYLNQPYYRGENNKPEFGNLPQQSNLLGFGLKYRGLQFRYMHMYRNTHSSIGLTPDLVGYYDPRNYWGENIDRVSLSYTKTWAKLSSRTNFSYLIYRLDNLSSYRYISDRGDRGVAYYYAASDDVMLEEVLNYAPNADLEITGGLSAQASGNLPRTNDLQEPFPTDAYTPFADEVKYNDSAFGNFGINPVNFYNIGAFMQLYYKFGRFTMLAGGRWDEHSIYGSQLSPRIGLKYIPEGKFSFKVNYGVGLRSPSLYYSYYSVAYRQTGEKTYEYIPNENIDPEKFQSLETGMEVKASDKIDIELLFTYHRLSKNLTSTLSVINYDLYPEASNFVALSYINDQNSEAVLYSGEARLRFKEVLLRPKLNADLFIKYSKGKEILPNNYGNIDRYRNVPKWFGQFNMDLYPTKKWKMEFHNVLSGKTAKRFFPAPPEALEAIGWPTTVKGYYTLDWINRVSINRNFQAFLNITNVFNAKYGGIDAYGNGYDLYYNPQYGRNFRLGLNFILE
ncbi:MAG TPA: TonB-dependent receptor [Bacteroidales bacterium]|nr:TonB-dependent receptor [Bacteroidales bacterium]